MKSLAPSMLICGVCHQFKSDPPALGRLTAAHRIACHITLESSCTYRLISKSMTKTS